MEEHEFHDLVIRMDQNLQNLVKAFDRAAGEEGFGRCAERKVRIENLELEVQTQKKTRMWLNRSVIVILLTAVINLLVTLANKLI
jgi:hypothetical protein